MAPVTAVQVRFRTALPDVATPPVAAASAVRLLEEDAKDVPAALIARTRNAYWTPLVRDPTVNVVAAEPVAIQEPEALRSYSNPVIAALFAAPATIVTLAEPDPFKAIVEIDGAAGTVATIADEALEATVEPDVFVPVAVKTR